VVDNCRVTDTGAPADPDAVGASVQDRLVVEPWGSGVAGATGSWRLEQATGTAAAAHGGDLPLDRRTVRLHRVPGPALVLGSTQPEDLVDVAAARAAGVEVARRRSGGGAVFLVPGAQAWIDLAVPVDDPLWDTDVGRASWWLGEVWADAIAQVTGPGASLPHVHHDGVDDRVLGRLVCFAALGPGEVAVDGRKVVGISQRRSRAGARFQCVVYRRWDPGPMLSLLRLGASSERVAEVLRSRAAAVEAMDDAPSRTVEPAGGWSVVEEFLHRLP
jgi:lipoate-protein ligase A